jgi:hypothetical protein
MANNNDSIDGIINSQIADGAWRRQFAMNIATTTSAATTNSGAVTGQRFPYPIVAPSSFGAGITGMVLNSAGIINSGGAGASFIVGLEYLLGTLTVSGNTFTDGVAMPTKKVRVNSETNTMTGGAPLMMVVIRTTLTATAPVLTITYTDQDGNTGNSCALTLPNSTVANSAFMAHNHLASGDDGVRDITNISISTGTAGVIDVYGLFPIYGCESGVSSGVPVMSVPHVPYLIEASENIRIYRFSTTSSGVPITGHLVCTADTF